MKEHTTRFGQRRPVGPDRRVEVDRRHGHRKAFSGERLAVTCWCEATVLYLPASEIAAGRTASCGEPRCHPPITKETAA